MRLRLPGVELYNLQVAAEVLAGFVIPLVQVCVPCLVLQYFCWCVTWPPCLAQHSAVSNAEQGTATCSYQATASHTHSLALAHPTTQHHMCLHVGVTQQRMQHGQLAPAQHTAPARSSQQKVPQGTSCRTKSSATQAWKASRPVLAS